MKILFLLLKYCFNFRLKQSDIAVMKHYLQRVILSYKFPFFGGTTTYFLFYCAMLLSTLKTI